MQIVKREIKKNCFFYRRFFSAENSGIPEIRGGRKGLTLCGASSGVVPHRQVGSHRCFDISGRGG